MAASESKETNDPMVALPAIQYVPIGYAATPFVEKRMAPRQGVIAAGALGRIVLFPRTGMLHAIEDLSSFSRIIVLFHFHLAQGFKPKVLPPRSSETRGVLATRSPHRPNPIGLSVIRLLRIEELVLHVTDLDLLDGTPILDIKPYVPYADAFPEEGSGWLAPTDPRPDYIVQYQVEAERALELLQSFGCAIRADIDQALALGPEPKPYRRIRKRGDLYTLAIKEFRVDFQPTEGARVIQVLAIRTGYREAELTTRHELVMHRALAARATSSP
jgi:tRNA (adenine37-N6)-methyltransferase